MIYATVNMTIGDYSSTCDNKILLYRGDKNVEIRIVMKGNKFTVLDSTYAQMIIRRPSATSVFSEPAPIQNDTVIFVITEDMIDELKEIGEYTFQVRLYDDTMTARATLPPCKSALIIERPIAVEGEAAVNLAMVNDSAVMLADTTISEEDIFTEDNKYNRTIWVDGDLITDARLNKIEDALYYINENGGNGSGGGATAPYISTELPEMVMVGSDENFDLHLFFNSPNIGKGTLRVFINDADSMSIKIDQGDSTTVVSNNLFAKGTNRVVVYVLDRVGVMSNSLVFYIRYGSTEISSDFDPYSAYDYGATIRYYFTPTALDTSLSLTFYMSIDGQVQQGVNCTSDTRGYYTFPTNLSADSHYCEAYVVDSKGVKSNVLSFNLIILDADTLVVASDTKEVSVEEGEQVSLDYKVYMKYNTSFIANIYVDDALVNTGTCNADFNYYKTSSLTKGVHTVKLEVFDVTETHSDYITWTVAVSDSTYEMLQPVNAGAMFIGTAVNKTNTDERKQYFIGHDQEGNEVLGTLTNFAFNSESGWVNDELIISGNSHVEIPVQPLANNAKYGFTLDIEFTSKQIGVPDAEVLTLWNDETNCGVKITTEKLILQSSNGNKCDLYFTDNEKTHVMFVIDRQELKAKIYLNGVMCEAFHLNDYTVEGVVYLDDFTVNSNIILGGLNTNGYCKIRNLRVYQVALTTDEIMNNFISCEIDKAKQRELSEFQKGNDLPTLYVYCDFSGLGKDDKKPCKIVYNSTNEQLYGKSFNLDHKQSQLQYQGTSSMAYPIKNYRLNLRDENGDKWYYTLPTAQPECRFTLKADFMSSGHWTNTGMAKFINDKLYNYNVNDEKSMNPFKWEHVQNGGKVNDFRETISGFPCRLILVNDGETPLNTGQNEPTPGNTKDMGIFNFNNDKDNVTTLGFNSDIFPNCASYEVTANSDTSAGAFMSYSGYEPMPYRVLSDGISTLFLPTTLLDPTSNAIESDSEVVKVCFGENNTWRKDVVVTNNETFSAENYSQFFIIFKTKPTYFKVNNSDFSFNDTQQEGGYIPTIDAIGELAYLKESFELRHPDADDVAGDWGFMGVEEEVKIPTIDYFIEGGSRRTSQILTDNLNGSISITSVTGTKYAVYVYFYDIDGKYLTNAYDFTGVTHSIPDGAYYASVSIKEYDKVIINGVTYIIGDDLTGGALNKEPYDKISIQKAEGTGLKALIDWVDNCTDEEFVADFEEHFHKDYTLRYFCLVTLIGAVDNLGKNMMLDTADNKIFFPRFYDIDTICSYDNSGQLKFDVDIEMEQGYWNTSSSRLWTRIRDLMHDDIVTTYNDMRQNGVSYENMMKYIYDEQIAKIPQAYYNKDYDVKYAPFADSYIGMAHGDTYEHVKRWLKQRFAFVDTLFDYAPSYNNDILTIRVNTTEEITLHLETYTPVYQHLSWYNGQMDKKKIDGKTSITFSGKVQAATDQEVLIYGGSNIKKITGIQSGNPNRLILGSATKLTELDASNCPLLAEINMNKANLSPHEYLNKVNLSNCPLLEGNLRLNNSPLIQELDIRGTKITGMNLPSSIRNLQVLKLPNTMTELTLNDAGMLHTLEFDEGVALQSISMTNCNALTNVINFDLLQTPSIVLNNSYNTAAELYFRDTTNLSLSNMSNLERVIFTPNNEYETFELINVANAPDYKVTTFNCPKLSTFVTTAPYRESYNNCGMKDVMGTVYGTLQTDVALKLSQSSGADKTTGYFYTTEEGKGDCVSDFNYYKLIAGNSYSFTVKNGTWFIICFYDLNGNFVRYLGGASNPTSFTDTPTEDCFVRLTCVGTVGTTEINILGDVYIPTEKVIKQIKDYGNIQPNTTFTANSIDISSTQFTDVKLLCTTDTNTLKLPTTVKNFYCDSSFDLDTDYLEDGDYDVVHGELVEPYTTDYESEVLRTETGEIITEITKWTTGYKAHAVNNVLVEDSTMQVTDYIEVVPGSTIYVENHTATSTINLIEYVNKDDTAVRYSSSHLYSYGSRELQSDTKFVRINTNINATLTIRYNGVNSYTPNLIPSSADGSLIFSMYAPSNTVAPASGTWDLHGLEFDNFHTFGMNNDVKPSEDSFMSVIDASNIVAFTGKVLNGNRPMGEVYWDNNQRNNIGITCLKLKAGVHIILTNTDRLGSIAYATDIGENAGIIYPSGDPTVGHYGKFTLTTDAYIAINFPSTAEYITIDGNYLFIKDLTILDGETLHTSGFFNAMDYTSPIVFDEVTVNQTLGELKSLSMPARYDDYNITIKNAYISPKTHNTMLYPLLVNEDNPITGTLDYTNYAGKHLSWSFAYTDEEYVNIIQPKDELLNSYEYRYNAFYDTEYEFDNPYEIARYTANATGVLPGFNKEFTYTYDEIDNGDGTYTTKVYADSLDNLPTRIEFYNNKNVLTVDKLNIDNITNMRTMFMWSSNITSINTTNWDTTKVTDMSNMFDGCSGLTSLDVSGFDTSNVTNMSSMFNACSKLTSLDVSGFDTSKVTNMSNMFAVCSKLTSLDVSGFDTSKVTTMKGMFTNCNNLTSLDVSGFDTSKVTTIDNMFANCSKLKTITGLGDLDTSNVTNIDYMFINDSALETWGLDKWDTSKIEGMAQTFRASSIGNDSGIENWKLPNLKGLYYTFAACKNLTRLDISGWVTENTNDINLESTFYTNDKIEYINFENWSHIKFTKLSGTFAGCYALTEIKGIENFDTSKVTHMGGMFQNCKSLTSLDVSGFDTSKVTNMQNIFQNCSGLTSLNVSNWPLDKVNTIIPQLTKSPSTSTLYGTVIIDETKLPSGWVYDNALIIAKYTANATGVLPAFNNEFTGYTTGETNNGDGTYTVSIATDSLDNLPTIISFHSKNNIITIDKLNTTALTTMRMMFQSCTSLTKIKGLNDFKTAGIRDMLNLFYGCSSLTSLDISSWDTSSVDNMSSMFNGCTSLTTLDVSGFDTSNVTNMMAMFNNCSQLTSLDVSGFDTSKVTNMASMFQQCKELTSLDVSGFNTGKVTTMMRMFDNCKALTSLDVSGFDTGTVASMEGMFGNCINLTELNLQGWKVRNINWMFTGCFNLQKIDTTNWDTSELTNIGHDSFQYSGLFYSCSKLTEIIGIENWNTSKITNMGATFKACESLITLDLSNWDTSNVTDMSSMFHGCIGLTHLDISGNYVKRSELDDIITQINELRRDVDNLIQNNGGENGVEALYYDPIMSIENDRAVNGFNTSKVTKMNNMFRNCVNLTELDLSTFDTSNVTDMGYMFQSCSGLTSLDLSTFDTSNVTNMSYMFYGCSKLTSLDLSKWDASKVENMNHAFCNCSSITELNLSGFTNVKDWGSFCRYCTKLVSIRGLDISKYSTNFGGNDQQYLSFQGCTSLRNIKDLNVSFTSAMAKVNSNSINNDYWMLCGWGWFNGLTNLVDITFTGQVELYDTMPVYYIFRGCDTTKFTHATWNTFVSIFPTTSTSKSIVLGWTAAILEAVPDEIKLALTQKGYTLTFRE